MKSPLAERPIFHHTERRTEAHIFLCVLAYHLLIAIEKTLLDHGIHTSWPTVRDTLKNHQICTVVLPTARQMSRRAAARRDVWRQVAPLRCRQCASQTRLARSCTSRQRAFPCGGNR